MVYFVVEGDREEDPYRRRTDFHLFCMTSAYHCYINRMAESTEHIFLYGKSAAKVWDCFGRLTFLASWGSGGHGHQIVAAAVVWATEIRVDPIAATN